MCDYIPQIHTAMLELAVKHDEFDMLQIRDRVREIVGPTVDVRFLPCKFEALTFFEHVGVPGFVLTNKTIETEIDQPLVNEEGQFSLEEDGALASETTKQSVFSFRKVAAIVHDELRPQWGHLN